MNLAEVIAAGDPEMEPARDQFVGLDGHPVTMVCCLTRTAILIVDDERQLVPLHRIQVDESSLRWQRREWVEGPKPMQLHFRRRKTAPRSVLT